MYFNIFILIQLRFRRVPSIREEVCIAFVTNKCGVWDNLSNSSKFTFFASLVARLFSKLSDGSVRWTFTFVDNSAGNFKFYAFASLSELLDKDDLVIFSQSNDVDPIGCMYDKKISVTASAFFLTAMFFEFKIRVFRDGFFRCRFPKRDGNIVL